jgi:signal transduction histidine kinase/streptogramin lyase
MLHWLQRLVLAFACLLAVFGGLLPCWASDKISLPEFLLRSWNRDDGLPAGDVQAVARTSDGYLWVGTSRGLAQFDGVRFVALLTNTTPGLGDHRITSLVVTRAGDLWIGTEGGSLVRRRAGGFETIALPPGSLRRRINALAEDGEGSLWVATRGSGVARWRQGSWEVFTRTNGLPVDGAAQLAVDKQGRLWGISGQKLVTFEAGRWQVANELASIPGLHAALAPARDGGIWVATTAASGSMTGSRIFKIKDRRLVGESSGYPWPQNTGHTVARVLYEDASGRLWAGLATAGVYYLEPGGQWQALVPQGAFSQILVNCLAEDDAGNLWVGLNGAQLDQVRPRVVHSLHLPPDASHNVVRMACARRDGSVWVGTDGAGVFRYKDGTWAHYGRDEGLSNTYIGVIFEDSHANLWVGTWSGLYRLEGERFFAALGSTVVRAMCEDRQHRLWVGTSGGILMVDETKPRVFSTDDGIPKAEVLAITQDAAGVMWAALVSRGLFRLNGERFEQVQSLPWPAPAEISTLLPDADGGLWLGSMDQGIAYMREGQAAVWTTQDGLPSDMILSLVEDQGNLWFASDNGFVGCPKERLRSYRRGLTPPLLCWQLSVADGLDSRRCSGNGQPIVGRAPDGRLWFPDSHSLASVDPALAPRLWPFSPVVIEEARVDGLPQPVGADGTVRVESFARNYEFHYTSPNLRSPERVRFRYQLKGSDPDWIEAGPRRVAYYSHLPAGEYQFRVMAGGPSGVWQETPRPLRLTVVPQLWERPVVRLTAGMVLLGGLVVMVWSVSRARLRRRLAIVERQRALERERSRIARDMHDELGARLTQVSLLSALADGSAGDPAEVRTHVRKISGVALDVTRSLDEIVWAVRPQNDNLESLVDYLDESLRDLCRGSAVRYWFSGPAAVPALEVPANVRHNALLACTEAVNNSLKHSGAREVRVSARLANGSLEIELADDGQGFDLARGEAKRSGLHHMRQRLVEIGGSCEFRTAAGQGTRIKFVVPLAAGMQVGLKVNPA